MSVHADLFETVKDAEEGLFQLKRARLLREADSALQGELGSDDVKTEPLDPSNTVVEPLADPIYSSYSVRSKCRFCHTNGRWYNEVIVGLEGSESAKISLLNPSFESMLVIKSMCTFLHF